MAMLTTRKLSDTVLELQNPDKGLYSINHIFEPEFHQNLYVDACTKTKESPGSFQVGDASLLECSISRGTQPVYADDETDPESLVYEGMITRDGSRLADPEKEFDVCALKSNCVRSGYIDTSLARSVSRKFYDKVRTKAAVRKNDILINSTGDGTIGRVAVYNFDFPAVVDGHITIVRYKEPQLAWYVAAFLLTADGQNQIYRYINGSSGQVEIYPQDISRIWIRSTTPQKQDELANELRKACEKYEAFYQELKAALYKV